MAVFQALKHCSLRLHAVRRCLHASLCGLASARSQACIHADMAHGGITFGRADQFASILHKVCWVTLHLVVIALQVVGVAAQWVFMVRQGYFPAQALK